MFTMPNTVLRALHGSIQCLGYKKASGEMMLWLDGKTKYW